MSELELSTQLSTVDPNTPKSHLYYGPPGSGKTTLFCHLANGNGTLLSKFLIDVDNKVKEIENFSPKVRESVQVWSCDEPLGDPDKVEIAYAPNPKDPHRGQIIQQEPRGAKRVVAVINELLNLARDCKRAGKPFPYQAAGLDSLTSLSEHIIRKVRFDQKLAFMSERNWGLVTQTLLEVLSGFNQLPCERVVIGHDRRFQIRDRETDSIIEEYIRPAVTGQLADTIARNFTEVYYFLGRERSGDYKIQTVKDRLLVARTGRDMPAEVIIDQKTKQLVLPK